MSFMYRKAPWFRLNRIIYMQIKWNAEEHKPIYKYIVTVEYKGIIGNGMNYWLAIAFMSAVINARENYRAWRDKDERHTF